MLFLVKQKNYISKGNGGQKIQETRFDDDLVGGGLVNLDYAKFGFFANGMTQVADVMDEIKLRSWKWWLSRVKPATMCLLYEWQREPLLCLDR
ncbi:unnamed protein product [Trifolium pratense]|uniref:Uncharacterized protein n=1 Tax=Trifolium pratense TaxID=57577 RepID=A0ACB0IC58_TRIPR|nr:unnamed protein product [Trifolium pratense]